MTQLRAILTVVALTLTAVGSAAFATLWEAGRVATWLKLGTVAPAKPTEPGEVDPAKWQTEWVEPWEVRFPGEPIEVSFKWGLGGDPPIGVRRTGPFEGYAIQKVVAVGVPNGGPWPIDHFAAANALGAAKSERHWGAAGVQFVERVYPTRHGDLTARAASTRGETCLLVAVGPRGGEFLESLRSTLPPPPPAPPPPPPPADPASIPGLVAHWPLDRVQGAALEETVSGNTAIVPRGYRPVRDLGRGPAGLRFAPIDPATTPPVELDFPRPIDPLALTICYWCRWTDRAVEPVEIRTTSGGPYPINSFLTTIDEAGRWGLISLQVFSNDGLHVGLDGQAGEMRGGHPGPWGAAWVGVNWVPTGRAIRDISVYDRVLSRDELRRLAGAAAE